VPVNLESLRHCLRMLRGTPAFTLLVLCCIVATGFLCVCALLIHHCEAFRRLWHGNRATCAAPDMLPGLLQAKSVHAVCVVWWRVGSSFSAA
jgi:hypothetical protein